MERRQSRGRTTATVTAPAGLLDLWLWRRAQVDDVETAGDLDLVLDKDHGNRPLGQCAAPVFEKRVERGVDRTAHALCPCGILHQIPLIARALQDTSEHSIPAPSIRVGDDRALTQIQRPDHDRA